MSSFNPSFFPKIIWVFKINVRHYDILPMTFYKWTMIAVHCAEFFDPFSAVPEQGHNQDFSKEEAPVPKGALTKCAF